MSKDIFTLNNVIIWLKAFFVFFISGIISIAIMYFLNMIPLLAGFLALVWFILSIPITGYLLNKFWGWD